MKKLNELKQGIYYAFYKDDKRLYVSENIKDAKYILSQNLDLKLIKEKCFQYYADINYENKHSYEITIVNIIVNNEKKQYTFKNSEGFSLCLIDRYYKENNISYELENIVQYSYSDEYGIEEEIIVYNKNKLVDKLLSILNDNNMGIIMSMINKIYSYQAETEETLKQIENLSTHYTIEGTEKECPIEWKRDFVSLCIYDNLTFEGIRNYDTVSQARKTSKTQKELIKSITIYQLFGHFDVTYIYSFYKLLFEENIEDPVEFIN